MAGQALFLKTCNFILSNGRCMLNLRPVQVNTLPSVRSLKHESLEKLKLLNIPEKPKRPQSSYIKFVSEHRNKVLKDNPNLKQSELIKKCAEDWRNVSTEIKEKYTDEYKNECAAYNKKIEMFNSKLTPEQRHALETVEKEKKSDREKRKIRKLYKETNKPKRPMGPYAYYIVEQSHIKNMSVKDLMISLKDEWANLPEAEKEKYKFRFLKEKEKYTADLAQWEAKMITEGKSDLIRMKSTDESTKPTRISQLKKKDPQ